MQMYVRVHPMASLTPGKCPSNLLVRGLNKFEIWFGLSGGGSKYFSCWEYSLGFRTRNPPFKYYWSVWFDTLYAWLYPGALHSGHRLYGCARSSAITILFQHQRELPGVWPYFRARLASPGSGLDGFTAIYTTFAETQTISCNRVTKGGCFSSSHLVSASVQEEIHCSKFLISVI